MSSHREGTLVVLACHCVYDPAGDRIYTDRPEFVNDRPVYEAQIDYSFRHLRWVRNWRPKDPPLLVVSGGYTKIQRPFPESRSYLEWVACKGRAIPEGVVLEEYALTSIENLLLSLYVYHEKRGVYPETVDVISWAFKRDRFQAAMRAISAWEPLGQSWPDIDYFPVGDLRKADADGALAVERTYVESLKHGLETYYANPSTVAIIARRDVFRSRERARERYKNYPLPF